MNSPESFDYVIVGAGTAGCTLAGRLSEDPSVSVALIEAGGSDQRGLVTAPMGLMVTVPNKIFNWAYDTLQQPSLDGRRGYQPRGKGMGGSSSINAMIYMRGHPLDYDEWAALGCHGWGWNDVLPYFLRSEGNTALPASAIHATDGPLKVSNVRSPAAFNQRFLDAGVSCGHPLNPDFNRGRAQEGVGWFQLTQHNGERWNAQRAYVAPALARGARLKLFQQSLALRLLIEDGHARGVEIEQDGQRRTLRARREVLLAAGAFGSPQLLMLSGIGPGEHLRSLGLPVHADLPAVGGNLQDHVDCVLSRRWEDRELFGFSAAMAMLLPGEWLRYRRERHGKFTTNFNESGGFLNSRPGLTRPDIGLHFSLAQVIDHGRQRKPGRGYGIHACVLRPESRGEVRLQAPDAHTPPLIDPRFLSESRDVDLLVQSYRMSHTILAAPAFADVRGKATRTEPDPRDDAAIRAWLRQTSDTIYHPVGTCRMGSDAQSVVDCELRVRGIGGLRVVDASVMPRLIGGNTNAPTYMIGEKAADLIRGKAPLPAAPRQLDEAVT